MELDYIQKKVQNAKKECLELCINIGSGHVTSAFSCAEIVCVLYYAVMNVDPRHPDAPGRDRFVMSKNHGMVMVYPVLKDIGFFSQETMETFGKNGGAVSPHSKLSVKGIDFAGGSLGIGLGTACGMAYAAACDKEKWLTFCIIGDGELYEGSMWEAMMFAGYQKLSNLVVILDRNKLCMTGFTESMIGLEPLDEKIRNFGWEVRVVDGHSIEELYGALSDVRERSVKKPLCILANTVKGKGIDFMEGNPFMHGVAPAGEKADIARKQVGNYGK